MGIRFRYRSVADEESGEGSRPPLGSKKRKKKREEKKKKNIPENRRTTKTKTLNRIDKRNKDDFFSLISVYMYKASEKNIS
jgi:hypothetical protein